MLLDRNDLKNCAGVGILFASIAGVSDAPPSTDPSTALFQSLPIAILPALATATVCLIGFLAALFAIAGVAALSGGARWQEIVLPAGLSVSVVYYIDNALGRTDLFDSFARASITFAAVAMSTISLLHCRRRTRTAADSARASLSPLFSVSVLLSVVPWAVWIGVWLVNYGSPELVAAHTFPALSAYGIVVLTPFWLILRRARWPFTKLLTALAGVLALIPIVIAGLQAQAPPDPPIAKLENAKPALILISVDTLRADASSVFSEHGQITPALEALARDSVVFTHAISPSSWTPPAMLSLMSGVSPVHHGVGMGGDPFALGASTIRLTTLAEHLRKAGFETRAIVGNYVLDKPMDIANGFDVYEVFEEPPLGHSAGARMLAARFPLSFVSGSNTRQITARACQWLRDLAGRQFFLWVHYMDPHWPYAPPPDAFSTVDGNLARWATMDEARANSLHRKFSAVERRQLKSLYNLEVQYIDRQISRLMTTLKRTGQYNSALIVFTSDHGEEFWDHGAIGHGHSMYQEVLRVPLLIKLPGESQHIKYTSPVPTQAVLPTVLDILDLEHSDTQHSVNSLGPVLRNRVDEYHAQPIHSASTYRYGSSQAVQLGAYKAIYTRESQRWKLFDTKSDPMEAYSLAITNHETLLTKARSLIMRHNEDAAKPIQRGKSALETLRRLKSLGYIQ